LNKPSQPLKIKRKLHIGGNVNETKKALETLSRILLFDSVTGVIVKCNQMRKSHFVKEYFVYKGDEFITSGNKDEVSKFLGIKKKSLQHKVWRSKKEPKGERYTVFTMDMEELEND
jgi:hypothetical protein